MGGRILRGKEEEAWKPLDLLRNLSVEGWGGVARLSCLWNAKRRFGLEKIPGD